MHVPFSLKKILIVIIGILSSCILIPESNAFVTPSTDTVTWAYDNGLTRYSEPTEFGYNRTISRQEAAAIVSRFAINVLGRNITSYCPREYLDADRIDLSLIRSVDDACALGIMNGANGYFSPTRSLTESEALAIVIRTFDQKKYSENLTPWYTNYVLRARTLGLAVSSGNLDIPVTRGTYIAWMQALAPLTTPDNSLLPPAVDNSSSLTLDPPSEASPNNTVIYSDAHDLEVGRMKLTARGGDLRITRITVTNGNTTLPVNNLTRVFTHVRLVNLANGATIATDANVTSNGIEWTGLNLGIPQNTTLNVAIITDTLSRLTEQFPGAHWRAQILVNGMNASTSLPIAPVNFLSEKTYDISREPSSVESVGHYLTNDNSAPASYILHNNDSQVNVRFDTITIRVAYRGNLSFAPNICLRNVGSTALCGSAGTLVGSNNNGTFTFHLAGSTLLAAETIPRFGGTAEFEVFVNNAPLWVAGDVLSLSLQDIKYSMIDDAGVPFGSPITESYVGVPGATIIATVK